LEKQQDGMKNVFSWARNPARAESSIALREFSRKTTNIVNKWFYLSQRKLNKGFSAGIGEAESGWVLDWISVRRRDGP
jgi:hypothetical protein